MTVAFWPGEDWSVADGAPEGVRFDLQIPSASNPERPYRIVRQETSPGMEGYLIHTPACPAWRKGNRMCSHVLRALETAEDPLRRFAIDVREAWNFVGFPTLDNLHAFCAAMVQSAEQAIAAADDLDRYEERLEDRAREARRTPAERDALADEAIAEFGTPDPRDRGVMIFEGRRTVVGGGR